MDFQTRLRRLAQGTASAIGPTQRSTPWLLSREEGASASPRDPALESSADGATPTFGPGVEVAGPGRGGGASDPWATAGASRQEPQGAADVGLAAGAADGPSLTLPRRWAEDDRQSTLLELRRMIARAEARGRAATLEAPPQLPLPGVREETPLGPVRRVENYLGPDHHHGRAPVAHALCPDGPAVAMLALEEGLVGIDWRRALYLDTETTGLSGGTGTLPFLVGCAWFEDDSLKVEQLFLESPAEEPALLEVLRQRIEAASCLISYNGKAFDWPLLVGRFVMARAAPPPVRPHLDLLHVARRCFRRRLGSVRLVEIEEQVLGFRRERDVDGAEIPGMYWSFLRHRDGTGMQLVLEHNANDLVALAALLGFVSGRASQLAVHDDPVDHLALAEVAHKAKAKERALAFARAAFEGGGDPEVTVRAGLLYAELLGRTSAHLEARQVLDQTLAAAGRVEAWASPVHLALAKLWEHRLRDPIRAELHARATRLAEGPEEHQRRTARLLKKIDRLKARAAAPPPKRRRRRPTPSEALPVVPGSERRAPLAATS